MSLPEDCVQQVGTLPYWIGGAVTLLSLVNGAMLLRGYLRDRPRIDVTLVHPGAYQWFFQMPPRTHEGFETKRYGFLAYLCIVNRGLRDVSIESWILKLKAKNGKWNDLNPISTPEPTIPLGDSGSKKVLPVLGQSGLFHRSNTMVRSGDSVSGMAYYNIEYYGEYEEEPRITPGETTARIEVTTVFGKRSSRKIRFKQMDFNKIDSMLPGIDKIT